MAKCEHHDEVVGLIERVENGLCEKIKDSNIKIDKLRDDVDKQAMEHSTTEAYVKQLYRRFDDLTLQITGLVSKLDQYINTQTVIDQETKHNTEFVQNGRKLIYDIIKYIVLVVLGFAIARGGS